MSKIKAYLERQQEGLSDWERVCVTFNDCYSEDQQDLSIVFDIASKYGRLPTEAELLENFGSYDKNTDVYVYKERFIVRTVSPELKYFTLKLKGN